MEERDSRSRSQVALFTLLLLATALRAYRLDYQSLWHDEGVSWYLAVQPLDALLHSVATTDHPPLYFVLLHAWIRVTGQSEFALRFLSLWAGVLAVTLAYALGKRLLGHGVGVGAALLLAVSPFHVWYSQEARGYTWVLALVLLSSILLLRAWPSRNPVNWLAYAGTATAALYTHFYAGFALLGHAVYGALRRVSLTRHQNVAPNRSLCSSSLGAVARRWLPPSLYSPLVGLATALSLTALAFLPWLRPVVRQADSNVTYWAGRLDVPAVLWQTLVVFLVGNSLSGVLAEATGVVGLVLALWGCWYVYQAVRERRVAWHVLLFLLTGLLVPAIAVFALSYQHPKYAPRYLLLLIPLYFLLNAGALAAIGQRFHRWANMVWLLLLAPMVLSLGHHYTDPAFAKPDMRGVGHYIARYARAGDAILVVGGHVEPVVAYYNQDALPVYPLPRGLLPRLDRPLMRHQVIAALQQIARQHQRVWLVLWQERLVDPRRLVLSTLLSKAQRLEVHSDFNTVSLLLFQLPPPDAFTVVPDVQHPLTVAFDNGLMLAGYDLTRGRSPVHERQTALANPEYQLTSAQPRFRRGETLYLDLYWVAWSDVEKNFTAFTHLVDAQDQVWGMMDRRLGGDAYPSSRWPPGEIFREEYPLPISPDTPPGEYYIEVGLYNRWTMARSPRQDGGGDRVLIGPVRVVE
ncbi:MAG TPA: hypothetical protein EYH31_12935 [Anaerolineae bacterium]|nr:hypothetical protein [Anaerolineae bacterium]